MGRKAEAREEEEHDWVFLVGGVWSGIADSRRQWLFGNGHCQGVGGGVVAMVSCICIARGLSRLFWGFLSGFVWVFDSGALAGLPCCLSRDKLQLVLKGEIFAYGRHIRVWVLWDVPGIIVGRL